MNENQENPVEEIQTEKVEKVVEILNEVLDEEKSKTSPKGITKKIKVNRKRDKISRKSRNKNQKINRKTRKFSGKNRRKK